MYTLAELKMLRSADHGALIPGVDTQTGDTFSIAQAQPLSAIPLSALQGFYYNAATNCVIITKNGAVISGYDFGTAGVVIEANNVTIKNCSFEG